MRGSQAWHDNDEKGGERVSESSHRVNHKQLLITIPPLLVDNKFEIQNDAVLHSCPSLCLRCCALL